MSKSTKVFVIVFLGVLSLTFLLWHAGMGLYRCYAYHTIINSKASSLASLRGKANKLDIPPGSDAPALSLGYAQICIRPELVHQIEYTGDGAVVLTIVYENCKVLFAPPYYSDWSTAHPNTGQSSDIHSIFQLDPFGYEFGVRAAKTMPKKYSEIFFMPGSEFLEYFTLASAKSQNSFNQNGIGIFETAHIRGLARFGESEHPNLFGVEVFCKQSDIRQRLLVGSKGQNEGRETLLSILASYRFLIAEIPDDENLEELILSEVGKHHKFKRSE